MKNGEIVVKIEIQAVSLIDIPSLDTSVAVDNASNPLLLSCPTARSSPTAWHTSQFLMFTLRIQGDYDPFLIK